MASKKQIQQTVLNTIQGFNGVQCEMIKVLEFLLSGYIDDADQRLGSVIAIMESNLRRCYSIRELIKG